MMTPQAFIAQWRDNPLKERASYQLHFTGLCDLLGVEKPTPASADSYCFERGATRTGAGKGWADVWKRDHFAFEYKAPNANLGVALKQLMTYALALDNPPLLVVCDTNILQIHTHFTNAPSETFTFTLDDLALPETLTKLRWLFTDPQKFHPQRTIAQITEEAAGKFAELAQSLAAKGHPPFKIAHFLNQCLFAMFAEDAELLPDRYFERLVRNNRHTPEKLHQRLAVLFEAMRDGGDYGIETIGYFNGGLFKDIETLPLNANELKILHAAAQLNWSGIEPSIFGTLFERGLDPQKRAQLGAHYTDPESILRIIRPVIIEPLAAEWEIAKATIAAQMLLHTQGGKGSKNAFSLAQSAFLAFLERLHTFRVLDPACGSGNFLFLALRALKDLEHKANLEAEMLGLQREIGIEVSPVNVLGIEINPYAAELARVTVWIGEIQWMLKNGYSIRNNPILQTLDHIECRDALLEHPQTAATTPSASLPPLLMKESTWPVVDVIIGNPPFLGDKKMRSELGDVYTSTLRTAYADRVAGGADLVTYWFEKARAQIETGQCQRAGLVATNSIRGGANQQVLARICDTTRIFHAWSDEEWVNDGAAVRVSIVCFGNGVKTVLNGNAVESIHADLTSGLNLTAAKRLTENAGVAFIGTQKSGAFDIAGEIAREWLKQPNPNGKPNSDIIRPWCNGMDITRRPSDTWIVDFGVGIPEEQAALFEIPFEYTRKNVHVPLLSKQAEWQSAGKDTKHLDKQISSWHQLWCPRGEMRIALKGLKRFIATPRVSKYRLFIWLDATVVPDCATVAIARDDDITFGILHSRFHELWSLQLCTWLGVGNDPRYTPTTTFETFPFPSGYYEKPPLTPPSKGGEQDSRCATGIPPLLGKEGAGVVLAAQELNAIRNNWLNPPQWVDWVQTPEEIEAGFPARPVAKAGHEAELKKRTLTNLYNQRPQWLTSIHQKLDAAVAAAYGWTDYSPAMPDEEILRRLLELNQQRG